MASATHSTWVMGEQRARIRLKGPHSWVLSCPAAQPCHRGLPGLEANGDSRQPWVTTCGAEGSDTVRGDITKPAPRHPGPRARGQRAECARPTLPQTWGETAELSGASSPGPELGQVGDCVPTLLHVSTVTVRAASSVLSCPGSCPAPATLHRHPGGSEPHCPQVSARTTAPHALPAAQG